MPAYMKEKTLLKSSITKTRTIRYIYWTEKVCILVAHFLLAGGDISHKKKHCIKFTDNIYFYLFYIHLLSLFLEHLGTFLMRGNLITIMYIIVIKFPLIPKCLLALQDQLCYFFTARSFFCGLFTGLGPAVHC